MELHINYVYSQLEHIDLNMIVLKDGKKTYLTLNTELYKKLTGKRICRNMRLEKRARELNLIRAYNPEYRFWSEIPLSSIESIHETNHYSIFS